MASDGKKTIAMIGGTGAMGRPIIKALSETNHYTLRVLTRDTQSEQAKKLAETYSNVELIGGDYSDEEIIRKLLTSVYGVFCNTDIWSCGGFKNEIDYGKKIYDIAKELSVKHFVYSSLDYTQKLLANHGGYRCWHYDGKAIVAEYIESHDPKNQVPWTIITTAPYYENFQGYFAPQKDPDNPNQLVFTFPKSDNPFIYVALDDIAWFVKYSFENPEKSIGKNYYIASESISMPDLVRTFTEVSGVPAKCNSVPLEDFVEHMPKFENIDFDVKEDFTGFYQQYIQGQVKRDFKELKAIHPGLLTWRQWLKKTGWKGEPTTVQTSKGYMPKK